MNLPRRASSRRRPVQEEAFLALVDDLVAPIFANAAFTRVPGSGLGWSGYSRSTFSSPGRAFLMRRTRRRSPREPIVQVIFEGPADLMPARLTAVAEHVERGEPVEAWVSFFGESGMIDVGVGSWSMLDDPSADESAALAADRTRPLEQRMAAVAQALRNILADE